MRRVAIVIALGLAASLARGDVFQLTQPMINALTPIDSIPSATQLNKVFNGSETEALASLTMIALSDGMDVGVQLRAIRALPAYCQAPCETHEAHATLSTIATTARYRDARRGSDLLVLRAAIEALGTLGVPADLGILAPHLDHPSRDIRAATAHALRDLGNPLAIPALRARYQQEQSQQVKIAVADALRVLGQPI